MCIRDSLGCEPNEIIFTASGSESDNLAIRGIAREVFLALGAEVVEMCIRDRAS